jgi:hypothetical protein
VSSMFPLKSVCQSSVSLCILMILAVFSEGSYWTKNIQNTFSSRNNTFKKIIDFF